jgi:hypothetical protein
MIFDDRKTVRMTLCMLAKSGEAEHDREDAVEEDEADDAVEEGRVNRLECVPRLIV